MFGIKKKQKKYFYNFFKDEEELLNVYKLLCPSNSPKNGDLIHYIFDQNLNILYKHSHFFEKNKSYAHFNEYKYY